MEVSSPLASYTTLHKSPGLSGPQFTQKDSKSLKQDSSIHTTGMHQDLRCCNDLREKFSRQEEEKKSAFRLHTCVSPTTL